MADYIFTLERRLLPDQYQTVQRLEQVCREQQINLYLTGGPMRDLLAGRPIRHLDFTLDGNPQKLKKALAREGFEVIYEGEREESLRLRRRQTRLRLSAAHTWVPGPGGKPQWRKCSVMEDLKSRGFTLDAIGLSLNPASRGLLLDPTNGLADIEARQIRMIQPLAFQQDPVLLPRALRLATRLEFQMEERTAARWAEAREENLLAHAMPLMLGRELEALAYEPDPARILRAWQKEKLLVPAFGKALKLASMNFAAMAQAPKLAEDLNAAGLPADPAPAILQCMLGHLPAREQSALAKLPLSQPLARWRELPQAAKALEKQITSRMAATLSGLYEVLQKTPPEITLFAMLPGSLPRSQKRLKEFCTALPPLRARLPILALRQLGANPDSEGFQQVIRILFRRMLQGELNQESELALALRQEAEKLHLIPAPAPAAEAASFRPGRGRGRVRRIG